ncbi:hypothetical protein DFJ58DRAFT_847955 [Suillus subalutaceus]|uniref:uncharacterized protein n=1 Tax=Suillus subalutaceus TaxID=48586 RepID=UPI001B86A472|nr:uncharacterized protein DFJ58DRAFT_847955 [Suillus subalutaceus]KAG1832617.1 hypothetical protein DFJ58DRAFT_847955 [Suillus subalutaceus]
MSLSSPSPPPALRSLTPALKSPLLALRSPSPALKYVSLALKSPMPALRSLLPALRSPSPALRSPSPALEYVSLALESLPPALKSLTPALESLMSALESPTPALESPTPALGSPLPLIQSIATVDAITSLDVVSNADKNIPTESQTIPAPKPVKITIMNPLSTLALCAANMQFPPPPSPPVVVNPVLGCAVQKATTSTAEPLSKPKKAKGKMRPSQTKNGRNLCAHRWLKQIKTNGTTDEFGVYYMGLAENQRTAYDKEAAELVATDKWDKTVGQGEMY